MKIARIEAIPLRIPFTAGGPAGAAVWGRAGQQAVDSLIVAVTTDTGVVGWGESFGFTAVPIVKAAIDHVLAPECIGRAVAQRHKLMLDLQKKLHIFGRSASSCMRSTSPACAPRAKPPATPSRSCSTSTVHGRCARRST
jgi:L-alanine-DL-glutamate epimerase-like enolase superfamily enzyme